MASPRFLRGPESRYGCKEPSREWTEAAGCQRSSECLVLRVGFFHPRLVILGSPVPRFMEPEVLCQDSQWQQQGWTSDLTPLSISEEPPPRDFHIDFKVTQASPLVGQSCSHPLPLFFQSFIFGADN